MQSPFFFVKNLATDYLVHFFDIKKVSQVYFTITYETISAERKALKTIIPQDATKCQNPLFASISTLFVILENNTKCQNVATNSCTNSCTSSCT